MDTLPREILAEILQEPARIRAIHLVNKALAAATHHMCHRKMYKEWGIIYAYIYTPATNRSYQIRFDKAANMVSGHSSFDGDAANDLVWFRHYSQFVGSVAFVDIFGAICRIQTEWLDHFGQFMGVAVSHIYRVTSVCINGSGVQPVEYKSGDVCCYICVMIIADKYRLVRTSTLPHLIEGAVFVVEE